MGVFTSGFLTVLSAALVAASFPPVGFGWFVFVALAPLLFVLREGSLRRAGVLAFLFGYLHGIGVFWWLTSVDGITLGLYLLVLAPLYALYYTAFGVAYRLTAGSFPRLTFLLGPALWVSMEFARASTSFLSLPWNLLGHTQNKLLPIIGIADLTGVYGVSFLLVMVNEAASRWIEGALSRKRAGKFSRHGRWSFSKIPTMAALGLVALTFAWSLARGQAADQARTVRVALLQPNLVISENMTYQERDDHLRTYSALTREAAGKGADLIAWPASSLPGSLHSRTVRMALGPLLKDLQVPLLVGGAGGEKMVPAQGKGSSFANTEFLIRPGGRPGGQYAKQRLVPFNEYLPLSGRVRWPSWITTLEGNYLPGGEDTVFVLRKARFGAPICWESLFPDLFRRFVMDGAEFMVNVTNEAYMGDTAGPWQTLAMNVFRAVENRVALARVSTTGITAFIAPDGKVLETVRDARGKELFVSGILVRDIPLTRGRTFYTRHGDLFAWFVIVFASLFLVAASGSRLTRRGR